MGSCLVWLGLRILLACGIVVSAFVVVLGILSLAAVVMAGDCSAVELRRVREIEADEEARRLDVEA